MKNLKNTLLIVMLAALSSTGLMAMHQPQKKRFMRPQEFASCLPGTVLAQLPPKLVTIVESYRRAQSVSKIAENIKAKKAVGAELASCQDSHGLYKSLDKLLKAYGYPLLVELLKDYFKNKPELLYVRDSLGHTVLHFATNFCNQRMVELLLDAAGERACDFVCMQDGGGYTLLHAAVFRNHEAIAQLAIDRAGKMTLALVRMQAKSGKTALQLAKDEKCEAIVQLLTKNPVLQQFVNSYSPGTLLAQLPADLVPIIASYRQAQIVSKIRENIKAKKAVEAELKHCKSPFILYESLEKLLQVYEYDLLMRSLKDYFENNSELLYVRDSYDQTVLHLAVLIGNQQLVKLLLGAADSALVLARTWNQSGKTALQLAKDNDREAMTQLLGQYYVETGYKGYYYE